MQAYKGEAEHVYVVTLSGKLSGSYNSAELGRNLYEEEHPGENKQIYVFNSRSASIGETIIGLGSSLPADQNWLSFGSRTHFCRTSHLFHIHNSCRTLH